MFHDWVIKKVYSPNVIFASWVCNNCGALVMSAEKPKRGRARVWGRSSKAHDELFSCEEWLIQSTMEA